MKSVASNAGEKLVTGVLWVKLILVKGLPGHKVEDSWETKGLGYAVDTIALSQESSSTITFTWLIAAA